MRTGKLSTYRLDEEEMHDEVQRILGEAWRDRYSQYRVREAINAAILQYNQRARCCIGTIDVQFIADQRDYNIYDIIDTPMKDNDLSRVLRVGYYDGTDQDWPQELLQGADINRIDVMGWESMDEGSPEMWHQNFYGYKYISFLPTPDTAYDAGPPKNHGALVVYLAIPTYIRCFGDGGSWTGLDDRFPTPLQLPACYYAAGWLLEEGGESELQRAQECFAIAEQLYQEIMCYSSAPDAGGDVRPI